MTHHIDISDPSVVKVPIVESAEPLISVVNHIELGPPPECPATRDNYHFVRQGVLARLNLAQQSLPAGLRLRLYEGYRSPEFQRNLFAQQLAQVNTTHPQLSFPKRYQKAAQLVAPVETVSGESLTPPHSSGGAVDIEIVDSNGEVIDFGMEIKDWARVPAALCATNASGLATKAIQNRALLVSVMEAAGFVNYSREWWHFSYGDQYWAYLSDKRQAHYGCAAQPCSSNQPLN
ncbi:M15 family metallopeptidase [Vibrio sp. WXL210]|uniref:M15 family metallopeptidase n=1 Tax=Vibrio sp. WXL210 TaxID=3450709 RepID=UPI003EC53737